MPLDGLGFRLKDARRKAKLRQVELAAAMGDRYDHSVISAVEHGRSSLRLEGLVEAARALGVSSDYLLGLTDESTPAAQLVLAGERANTPRVIEFPGEEGKSVAVRELRTAAGAGALDLDESISRYAYFRASWLRRHGLNPARCCIIGVTGDSMEPTLPDGCSILLDRNRKEPRDHRIFVVRTSEGLVVKRLARDGSGGWTLASDNPEWKPIPWPDDAQVVGQVAWSASTLL